MQKLLAMRKSGISCLPLKNRWFAFPVLLLLLSCGAQSTVIDLPAAQSMSITGKGPGQDAAINPFSGGNSVARVKNIGSHPFSVRVQDKEGNYKDFTLPPGETRDVFLLKGKELYLDSNQKTRARVSFRKSEK